MAMALRSVARATQPHLPTLADSLAPLLAVANCGAFHLRYQGGAVLIEQATFAGVDTTAVDTAVANAPQRTDALDAKTEVDRLPLLMKAILLSLVDAINVERAQHGRAAITAAQAYASVKTKIDGL